MINTQNRQKLSEAYYSPSGYWKGTSAITHLIEKFPNIPKEQIKWWMTRQAL